MWTGRSLDWSFGGAFSGGDGRRIRGGRHLRSVLEKTSAKLCVGEDATMALGKTCSGRRQSER
jgi:hypothetical protein